MFFSNLTTAGLFWIMGISYLVLAIGIVVLFGAGWKRADRPSFIKRAVFGIPLMAAGGALLIGSLVNLGPALQREYHKGSEVSGLKVIRTGFMSPTPGEATTARWGSSVPITLYLKESQSSQGRFYFCVDSPRCDMIKQGDVISGFAWLPEGNQTDWVIRPN